MRRTVPPSAEIEAQIDQLLAVGVGDNPRESLSELARLGARLIIQRAVEDEFDAWLGRARYERRPEYQRGLRNYESGLRNGFRPRRCRPPRGSSSRDPAGPRGRGDVRLEAVSQDAEAVADRAAEGVGDRRVRPWPVDARRRVAVRAGRTRASCRSRPPRGSARSCATATSSSSAAISTTSGWWRCFSTRPSSAVRPSGPKEGVLVAWGFTEDGERVLLAVTLGMRESYEDWQALGRDLIARGLGAPMLIVADGAPGLIKAIEQCWPASDRQRCCVHRARNLYAKLPERERERVKHAYWRALDDAINPSDAKQRLQALVDELDKGGFTAAAKCLADDLDALVVHLRYPPRHRRRWRSTNLLERSLGEVKRRTKVMGRFPGEESCLTLVWAVLDLLITHQTNGIRFNQLDRQRLKR